MLVFFFFFRSNHQICSVKKGFLRNFAKFTGKHRCQSLIFNKTTGLACHLWATARIVFWTVWNIYDRDFFCGSSSQLSSLTEAVFQRCSVKKDGLIKFDKIHRKTPVPESLQACNFIKKETLTQVFPCEFFKIFKNTYCYRTPLVATSEFDNKENRTTIVFVSLESC